MIADWILASILGSVLTLAASMATLFVKDYTNRKQKDRDRVIEEVDNAIGDMYSPLYFYIFDVGVYLGRFSGLFENFVQIDPSKKDKDDLIQFLKIEIERFKSTSIRELLVTKIGYVRPTQFRSDLFLFFQALDGFENALREFADVGFGDDIAKDKKWMENMDAVASRFCVVTQIFIGFLDKLMMQREKGLSDTEYETVIPIEDFSQMLELIYSNKLNTA